MRLRSGLTIKKEICYFEEEHTESYSLKSESCASLSTYNDQCVSFKVLENGRYLQKCQVPLPEEVYFVLHRKSSDYVLFECKNQPGTYIGVKDNQLALIEEKNKDNENIMFKLSKV
ncbi:hypothetical protein A6R68_13093, partial [Neotoma lepida]